MTTLNLISKATGNEVNYLDLTRITIEKNSDLFKIDTIDNEQVLLLTGNIYDQEIDDFTGKKKDDAYGKVILFGDRLSDYSMTVDMKFAGFHDENSPTGGWFGFALRAQDVENYEVVWFMPGGGGEFNKVAYVPVAHGIVPWWTEAYEKQEKGNVALPINDWFTARIDLQGDEFSVYVNNQFVFKKKITYYLSSGKPGIYVGTATDVAVRRIKIYKIKKE
ncbi:MAG TPA: hypothetical protein PK521_05130 [Bacteroidales bacterium]|jgi:hypothetical protein|nr:hypothetical protein [Bacteroidales bacterium]HOX75096.1 hypothetical protein [Bacteroidales bacterium]HQM68669.1 hypothetical protein [Bacteroidales bacterium]